VLQYRPPRECRDHRIARREELAELGKEVQICVRCRDIQLEWRSIR
jgi:hypothetical protein